MQGSRYIVFGSYDRIGRNVGVLFAWLGMLCIAPALVVRHHRRKLRAAGVIQ